MDNGETVKAIKAAMAEDAAAMNATKVELVFNLGATRAAMTESGVKKAIAKLKEAYGGECHTLRIVVR